MMIDFPTPVIPVKKRGNLYLMAFSTIQEYLTVSFVGTTRLKKLVPYLYTNFSLNSVQSSYFEDSTS